LTGADDFEFPEDETASEGEDEAVTPVADIPRSESLENIVKVVCSL
jgi:hypothetical protein